MAKNPKIELPLRNDFGILCDPKIAPQKTADTVCFTLPKKWTQPVQNWGQTAQQLAILFPDRFRILA